MKQLLPPANATFVAASQTITFATTIPSTISHILHVTNITRGVIYYQPQAGTAYSGTYASPVLTLLCSTSGHADADKLEIFYDDGATGPTPTIANLDVALSTRTKPADQQHTIIDSGTTAATQSGTWTVQPGNTANTTAWKVDGSAVTQPVSASALPLPTGAATLAKQPALGTAGTAAADVISIQGIASMTAVKVDGSAVTQPVSIATAPALVASSAVIGHVIVDTAPTTAVTVASLPSHAVTNAGTFAVQLAAQPGAANCVVTQTATSTTHATLVAARATRRKVTIKNIDTSITVYVGPATVTSANGFAILAGESFAPTWVGLIDVIAAPGTPTVVTWDEYD